MTKNRTHNQTAARLMPILPLAVLLSVSCVTTGTKIRDRRVLRAMNCRSGNATYVRTERASIGFVKSRSEFTAYCGKVLYYCIGQGNQWTRQSQITCRRDRYQKARSKFGNDTQPTSIDDRDPRKKPPKKQPKVNREVFVPPPD